MKGVLDDERLEGPHEARVVYRPQRVGIPVSGRELSQLVAAIKFECQLWGGATAPLVPLASDGRLHPLYRRLLPGSAVDGIWGLGDFELRDLEGSKPDLSEKRERFGTQLAVALLEHRRQDAYRRLEVVELDDADPWRAIYAACLGLLPDAPDEGVLRAGHLLGDLRFEDFVNVDRVSATGSLDDLMERLNSDVHMTPRSLSMIHLAYGSHGSSQLRSDRQILPEPYFPQFDAGPNVVVVCSPDNIEDIALLWNLRGAHGDFRSVPIGIPVDEASPSLIQAIIHKGRIARNGSAARSLYVTSASVSVEGLVKRLRPDRESRTFAVVEHEAMLTFGYPGGWARDEVLTWHNGTTRFVPLSGDSRREVFESRALGDMARMYVDVEVLDDPFPSGEDIRVEGPSSTFYAGSESTWGSSRMRTEVRTISWPSRLLMAKTVAATRDLELVESEPGRAGRVALNGLSDMGFLGNLAHAPLLAMLEEMATRQGFGWYKQRLRDRGDNADPASAIGPTTDELPEKSFPDFKRALGNNEKATKYWLLWAEQSNLLLKGFQLQCSACRAKQWVPVNAFAPPLVCRGCAEPMGTPFGDRPNIDFKYRLSERLRRVYESDAMGHLLVAQYFHWLFRGVRSSRLIGLHPGMEVRRVGSTSTVGEADVLMLTREAEFIPVEVKRTSSGFSEGEIGKLESLAAALGSPWSAVATCQYAADTSAVFKSLEKRDAADGPYRRVVLTYEKLLQPFPSWSLGEDPFELKPMTPEEITQRERAFVSSLVDQGDSGPFDWMAEFMLRSTRHDKDQPTVEI